jgi:hypothetical protein
LPEPPAFRLLFTPLQTRADSLIVADRLAAVSFSYLRGPRVPNDPDVWVPVWDQLQQLPQAIRVELQPLEDVGRLRPVAVVSEVRARYGRPRRLLRR